MTKMSAAMEFQKIYALEQLLVYFKVKVISEVLIDVKNKTENIFEGF